MKVDGDIVSLPQNRDRSRPCVLGAGKANGIRAGQSGRCAFKYWRVFRLIADRGVFIRMCAWCIEVSVRMTCGRRTRCRYMSPNMRGWREAHGRVTMIFSVIRPWPVMQFWFANSPSLRKF